jgi:hypothetical protein
VRRLVLLTLVLCGCGSHAAAAGTRAVVLRPECGKAVARPARIVLTCADAGMSLAGLRWTGWGREIATATGAITVHGCDPDCADDNRLYSYRVRVTAHDPVTCTDGSRQYAFIRVDVTDPHHDPNRPVGGDTGFDCPG